MKKQEEWCAEINELAHKCESLHKEEYALDDILYRKLNQFMKKRKCPCCGASNMDGFFAYDCRGGHFAISCSTCGMSSPHTSKIEVALNFFEALANNFTGDLKDIRDRDGNPIIVKRRGKKND